MCFLGTTFINTRPAFYYIVWDKLHTSQMGAFEMSHFISKLGNPSNPLSTLCPQISVLFQLLDQFLIEGYFAKEKWKHVKLHIWVFPPLISPKILVQFDYFEKLATLKIIVFGEGMVGQNMIQL